MASTSAQSSLSVGGSVASGVTVDFTTAKKNVTAVIVPSATLSGGIVTIEASQDNTNWVTQRVVDVTGRENYAVHTQGVAFRYWRASVVRALSGGTVRVTFMEAD